MFHLIFMSCKTLIKSFFLAMERGIFLISMSILLNRSQYTELLTKYQPKIIETEEEYRQTLAVVEYFVFKKERSLAELTLYDLAIMLIKDYESRICPMDDWRTQSPTEMLQYLLETSGKRQADLVGVIGSSGIVSEVVNGKRAISKSQAKKLGEMFQVSPSLFI
jgi:HTH-type transcriptional regulator / antitoxin HigA